MFQKVGDADLIRGEHEMLKFWTDRAIFAKRRALNAGRQPWSFLDGPMTANNPMGVHHAWGRTYKDAFQRYWAMNGRDLRYQNGFDCQGLWVEVEVEKQLGLGAKSAIEEFGVDKFVWECKKRVLKYAAVQTEQSVRLGYWMEWDDPQQLRKLAEAIGTDQQVEFVPPKQPGTTVRDTAEHIVERLGSLEWGGSYFTFSTDNNETIWTFLKKCFERGKVYRGHDVMPWSGRGGSAYSQMEVADGRKLTVHRALFVRFPILSRNWTDSALSDAELDTVGFKSPIDEYLLIWTTTPWTLTSNIAAMVNPEMEYVKLKAKRDGAVYYFAKDNLENQRLAKEFKEGFGRPEWSWPKDCPKLKTLSQMFKEQGGYEIEGIVNGSEMLGWRYVGPFDDLRVMRRQGGVPKQIGHFQAEFRRSALDEFDPFGEVFLGSHETYKASRQAISSLRESYQDLLPDEYEGTDEQLELDIKNDSRPILEERDRQLWSILSEHVRRFVRSFRRMCDEMQSVNGITIDAENLRTISDCDRAIREFGLPYGVSVEDWMFLLELGSLTEKFEKSGLAGVRDAMEDFESRERLSVDPPILSLEEQCPVFGFESRLDKRFVRCINSFIDDLLYHSNHRHCACHRIIDGGRDNKGNQNVVAGEGTGIVHSAPGCGDVDHVVGVSKGLPAIAPLDENGRFLEGFGEFTGRSATDPETVDLVIRRLKEKGLLVAEEKYPHIYPFCWRTGDELVFRLVDEWFINMDWREEIMDVTRQIRWLPDSIQGQDREVEWLSIMRDWMISKKRFWGLALPIWVDDVTGEFEVIGSLAELKERAVEGWDEFEGHTPHKPWIDKVKLRNPKTGNLMTRVPDVGNPWLDAGIVPFSTLGYNTDRDYWQKWFPADLVTECFPGQFRNWFYSMLALATMMRHDEATAADKQPFKTLLGHRLVMNEEGKPMHKSDGTAIWFEEAAEQLGVDTMRWMYLAQNPASDLKFGTRHPDQKVTLPTLNGPTDRTIDGVETCLVTSSPSDEVRRQVLLPLWNSYAFFVNYARLDGFDPTLGQIPVAERPEIDRWILSNLQALIGGMRAAWENYDSPEACRLAAGFIDDLSNWYIRRNRRRFWRSRETSLGAAESPEAESRNSASRGREVPDSNSSLPVDTTGRTVDWRHSGWDPDKLAAYQTLHGVLVTLTKLLAPMIPFLSERMYQNLVDGRSSNVDGNTNSVSDHQRSTINDQPESVHLCDYPTVDETLLDAGLNERMALAQVVVKLGHKLRETADQRVRQPLPELRFASTNPGQRESIERLADVIGDELNIKRVTGCDSLADIVRYTYRANLKTLGPKYGKLLNLLREKIPALPDATLTALREGQSVTVNLDGNEVTLAPEDVQVGTEQAAEWVVADERGVQVALSLHLTPELLREGMARDFIRQIQQLRKDANLEIEQRIRIGYASDSLELATAIAEWGDTIRGETLADSLTASEVPAESKSVSVGDAKIQVWMEAV